jgi:hypothetical protein
VVSDEEAGKVAGVFRFFRGHGAGRRALLSRRANLWLAIILPHLSVVAVEDVRLIEEGRSVILRRALPAPKQRSQNAEGIKNGGNLGH